jgi:hypothetical protein
MSCKIGGFLGHTYFLSQDSELYLCNENSGVYYLSGMQKIKRESILAYWAESS